MVRAKPKQKRAIPGKLPRHGGRRVTQLLRDQALRDRELAKTRCCPMCNKKFTWKNTREGQIYCSRDCAFSDPRRPIGRPCAVTDDVLAKLKIAFQVGATDEEACRHAGISKNALISHIERHPEYKEEKEALKESSVLKARVKIFNSIDKDVNTARWILEKKRRKEFGNKLYIDGSILTGEMDEEDRKRVQQIAEAFGEDD